MSWIIVARVVFFFGGLFVGYWFGGVRSRMQIFSMKPRPSSSRDETVLVHEGVIEGDKLRLTIRTRSRIASFLVPREIVYHMSDDLLRSAAHLGKRGEVQRGPE